MMRNAVAIATICALGAALLSACDPTPDDTKIHERVLSPDTRREMVHAQIMGGGATVSDSQGVYVVEPGRFPRIADRIFSANHVCHLKVRWLTDRDVEISYAAKTADQNRSEPTNSVRIHYRWRGPDASSGC